MILDENQNFKCLEKPIVVKSDRKTNFFYTTWIVLSRCIVESEV